VDFKTIISKINQARTDIDNKVKSVFTRKKDLSKSEDDTQIEQKIPTKLSESTLSNEAETGEFDVSSMNENKADESDKNATEVSDQTELNDLSMHSLELEDEKVEEKSVVLKFLKGKFPVRIYIYTVIALIFGFLLNHEESELITEEQKVIKKSEKKKKRKRKKNIIENKKLSSKKEIKTKSQSKKENIEKNGENVVKKIKSQDDLIKKGIEKISENINDEEVSFEELMKEESTKENEKEKKNTGQVKDLPSVIVDKEKSVEENPIDLMDFLEKDDESLKKEDELKMKKDLSLSSDNEIIEKSEKSKISKIIFIDYNKTGRGLVYSCKFKHWACIDRTNYFNCKNNSKEEKLKRKKISCKVFDVYKTDRDCHMVQIIKINKNKKIENCLN
jgi:hypothetical protein